MNGNIGICPKCKQHSNIELLKDSIDIQCNCGYSQTINLVDYIQKIYIYIE